MANTMYQRRFIYAFMLTASLCSAPVLIRPIASSADTKDKASGDKAASYKEVQAILKARCIVCHSKEQTGNVALSGGLALDTYAALKTGSHPVVVPGKLDISELYQRLITTSPTRLMPKGGPALPPEQIALVKKWIAAGAPGPTGNESAAPTTTANVLPMPALAATQEVSLKTRVGLPAPLLEKVVDKAGKPLKEGSLALALKIGPLPPLNSIAFSPDGKRLAVGGYRALIVWDTTTGQPVGCVSNLSGPVQTIAYRPDGSLIAIASGNPGASGEVKVVDAKTLAPVGHTLGNHTDVVFGVAWSPDGNKLATGSQDKTARMWEWPSGKELYVIKDHSDAVTRVAFAPDGKSLYTASLDHNARRFDVADGKVLHVYSGHNEGITALAVRPNGDRIVTSGSEPEIRWWPIESGDPGRQGGHSGTVNDIVFSKDMKLVATAGADHTVRLWDGNSTGQIRALTGSDDWMYAAAISPDDKLVAGAGADGFVRIWEAATGRLRLSLVAWPPAGKNPTIEYLAVTPEGYFDASPGWAAVPRPQIADQNMPLPKLSAWLKTLKQPENVTKGWQSGPLEPPKVDLPAPAPVTPGKDTKAPVAPPKPGAPTTKPEVNGVKK